MNTIWVFFLITSSQYNLPKGLLPALCYVESNHKVNAVHHDDGNGDSLGICQIKLATAQSLGFKGTEEELMNPKTNIHYAGKYLAKQLVRYDGSVRKAVIAYNQGRVKTLTTTKYQVKVFNKWRQYYEN
jgi:soluble lytic murein transglycosylase-like protein